MGIRRKGKTGLRYDVVILDIDGTIVDSNDAHAHAWVKALAQHGHDVNFDGVRSRIGMGGDKLLKQLVNIDSESAAGRAISESKRSLFASDYLPALQPTPGARPLIEWLKTQGAVVTIATSATEQEVSGLLRAADVGDLIDAVASSDDAEESKPDPDIVNAALKRSGGSKECAIMIGDTPYDIEAATAAGIDTIAFRSGGWPDTALKHALAIFDHPEDLVTHWTDSPLARGTEQRT